MDTIHEKTAPMESRDDGALADRSISHLLTQVALSRAAELARRGSYRGAEMILGQLLPGDSGPAPLDLLARIRAQQGCYPEAKALWTRVLEILPTDAAASAGLARIAQIEGQMFRRIAALKEGKGDG
jgi:hypothetical protein